MGRTKKNKVNDVKSNSTAKENEQISNGDDDSKGKYVKANRPLLQLNKGNLNNITDPARNNVKFINHNM